MKTRIATAISVVGVLGAGSAAALVNTQILDGGAAESTASAAVLPTASTVDVTIPEVPETLPPESTAPTTQPTETSAPEPTLPDEPEPTGYLTAFNVGQAGVVTVDVIEGQIVLVDAEPKSGWSISDTSEDADDNEIEVEFASGTVRVEFEAAFVDGQIVPKVTSRRVGGSTSPAGTPPPSGTAPLPTGEDDRDDGYDDDKYDDDEYDDDKYDDDEYDDDSDDEYDDDEEEDEPEQREDDEEDEQDEQDEEDDEDEDRDDD